MDGDEAGKHATYGKKKEGKERPTPGIYSQVKMNFDTHVVKMWRLAKKLGLKKVDPYDAPVILLHKLRKMLV
jgi:hypothetical protein